MTDKDQQTQKNTSENNTKKKTKSWDEVWRIIKFVLFSISAGVIEFGAFTLLTELTSLDYWPRYLTALILSILWNFTLNRNFTFKAANNVPIAMLKVAAFYAVFTPVTTILGNYLAEEVGVNDYIVTLMNMGLNITTEYLYQRFVVFRNSIDTNKIAQKQEQKKKENKIKNNKDKVLPFNKSEEKQEQIENIKESINNNKKE